MRRLIALVLIAGGLWAGYWFVAARGLNAGLTAWLDAQQGAGWTIARSHLGVHGFPNRLDTTIDNIAVTTPDGRTSWQAPFVQIMALSYRPNQIIAVWPHQQTLRTPSGNYTLQTTDMRASALLLANMRLPLDHANLVIKGIELRADSGWTLRAGTALVAIRQQVGQPGVQELGLDIQKLTLPPEGLARIGAGPGAPGIMQRLRLDAALRFDKPLDRFALKGAPPHLRGVTLKSVRITWGDMTLTGAGAIAIDRRGRLSGKMTLRASNWQRALRLIPMPGKQATRLKLVLAALIDANGDLNVTLGVRDGQMFAGALPLGPAPVLQFF